MRRRYVWLCLSLLACACGVEDSSESADLSEDFSSADQPTDQTPEDTQEDVQDVLVPDQQDEVHDLVDMTLDTQPDDAPLDTPVEVDIPADIVDMDLEIDMSIPDMSDQNDIDLTMQDIIEDVVDTDQDAGEDIENMDSETILDIPEDVENDVVDLSEDMGADEGADADVHEDMENIPIDCNPMISPDCPTDIFIDMESNEYSVCAIREIDNLKYCWGGRTGFLSERYTPFRSLQANFYRQCSLLLNGDVSCDDGNFFEGPFIDVEQSFNGRFCLIEEGNHTYCVNRYPGDRVYIEEFDGLYKEVISVDLGICGITLNDTIRCEHPVDFEEDDPYLDIYYDIIYEYPTDIAIKKLTWDGDRPGQCVCALRTDDRIQCWGQDNCQEISAHFSGEYSFVSSNGLSCAIDLGGRVQCVNELQQNAEYLNQFSPLKKISQDSLCALKTNGQIVCMDRLPPVSETTGRKIVVERGDYCSLDEEGYATCRSLETGRIWTSTPDVRFSLIKLEYEGAAYGLDIEGRFYHWAREPRYLIQSVINLDIPENFRAKDVFPGVRGNVCFHKLDDTVQCFLYNGWEPTAINEQMPEPDETFLSVDMSYDSACGVSYSGEIRCWGDIDYLTQISEVENQSFTSITMSYRGLCLSDRQNNYYCFNGTDNWVFSSIFDGPIDKLVYFDGYVWCGLRDGEFICDSNLTESWYFERQFQMYNFSDVSSDGYFTSPQMCGIRNDVNTVVCRGSFYWGW